MQQPPLRSRNVSSVVLSARLDVHAPPARLLADWQRETLRLALEPGDVEPMLLARARRLWPDYRRCVQAVSDWTRTLGLGEMLAACDVALMACRSTRHHRGGAHYGAFAFCKLFLGEDRGLDLHFPATGRRIALVRGVAVIFDTGQPHGVIARGSACFEAGDFSAVQDLTEVSLGHAWDTDASGALALMDEQMWHGGAPARVCPDSGRWLPVAG